MPLYEYRCESCGHTFEVIQRFSDPAIDTCPVCGGQVEKLLSPPAIHFKGSGWYITDYARKSSPESKSNGSSAASLAKSSTESTSGSTSAASSSGARSSSGDKSLSGAGSTADTKAK